MRIVLLPWTCRQTGDCCMNAYPVMTPQERDAILDRRPELAPHFSPVTDGFTQFGTDAQCPALGEDKRCTVYDVRPYNCRRFSCYRVGDEPYQTGGPLGCQNLSDRMIQSRPIRRDYALNQRKAARWALQHGWTPNV